MNKKVLGEMGEVDESAQKFLSSLEEDRWIFEADINVGKAHTLMLLEQDIIPKKAGKVILKALDEAKYSEISGEDVHIAIESFVKQKIGKEKGGWLHTARSRNDEVATCVRMRLRDELIEISYLIINLIESIQEKAEQEIDDLLPGFTHLQHAEPTTIGHHLLSYSQALIRDLERLIGSYKRTNRSPLGAGALSTTTFEIDREKTAQYLGFDDVIENSIDAVSSRDFIIEAISSFNNLMLIISNLSEELILWNSKEFNYVDLPDEFTSTSSIMPQKKNPDILELIRAKSSSIEGNLVSVSGMINSKPRAYNRDLQEINPKLLESITITKNSLQLLEKIIKKIEFNYQDIQESLEEDNSEASELANLLVRKKKMPFREAHNQISKLIKKGHNLKEISQKHDIDYSELGKDQIVSKKQNIGSTSKRYIKNNLKNQKNKIKNYYKKIMSFRKSRNKKLKKLDQKTKEMIKKQ
ncbi:argininosuccinate lyase [archaeon SCG-AAA382B04]|nr:argininosuccinate lyase [archaeon SCG-AAA382B04]